MHILITDISGRQYALPAKETAIAYSAPGTSGQVHYGKLCINTKETFGELCALIEAASGLISTETLKIQQEEGKHAESCRAINERAANEAVLDDRELLTRYGCERVNAVHHDRRQRLHLPVIGPLIFEKDGKIQFHTQNATKAAICETAKALRAMDGSEIERCVQIYREFRIETAGM